MTDRRPAPGDDGRPPPAVVLTLLYRAYCHLCDEMLEALRPLARTRAASIEAVDVDRPEHAALEREWGERVPVLFLGAPVATNELCHYRLDAPSVEAALAVASKPEFASPGKIR